MTVESPRRCQTTNGQLLLQRWQTKSEIVRVSIVESDSVANEAEIENDFQKKCRKGAKFAAHTAFSAILGEISCLLSLALEFSTRFRGGLFLAIPQMDHHRSCPNESRRRKLRARWTVVLLLNRTTLGQNLY